MADQSGFFKGEKKKKKKSFLEKKARQMTSSGTFVLPEVEIVGRKKSHQKWCS